MTAQLHLFPCRTCGAPAIITFHPLAGAPYCLAECSEQSNCPDWDMTRWHISPEDAAQAWNEGRTISCDAPRSDERGSNILSADPWGNRNENEPHHRNPTLAESQVAAPQPNRTPQHNGQQESTTAEKSPHEGAPDGTESTRESDAADAQGNATHGASDERPLLNTQVGGAHRSAAGQLPPMPIMSAEDSIATYSDDALLGAAQQLRNHERAGRPDSWEAKRLLALLREIRRRRLDRQPQETQPTAE